MQQFGIAPVGVSRICPTHFSLSPGSSLARSFELTRKSIQSFTSDRLARHVRSQKCLQKEGNDETNSCSCGRGTRASFAWRGRFIITGSEFLPERRSGGADRGTILGHAWYLSAAEKRCELGRPGGAQWQRPMSSGEMDLALLGSKDSRECREREDEPFPEQVRLGLGGRWRCTPSRCLNPAHTIAMVDRRAAVDRHYWPHLIHVSLAQKSGGFYRMRLFAAPQEAISTAGEG